MLKIVEVGSYNLPKNVVKDVDTAIGKYAAADMAAGDYILSSKLTDVPAAENAYLYHLDGEKQAISVTLKSFATGLSGKLATGDIVSVIAPDYKKRGTTVIPAELKYVEVIAVTANTGYDTDTGGQRGNEDEKQLPSTVTFWHRRSNRKSCRAGGGRQAAPVPRVRAARRMPPSLLRHRTR